MNLSAKTTLIAFWVFCIICVTFAPYSSLKKKLFDQINKLTISGNTMTQDDGPAYTMLPVNELDNSASASNSKDECIDAIKTVFEDPDPEDNLKHGFYNLNKDKFNKDDKNYKYTYGYYIDLVNIATAIESPKILTPQDYCKEGFRSHDEYIRVDCLKSIKEIKEIKSDTSGTVAYKFMYLTLDDGLLNVDHIFPGWAPEKDVNISQEKFDEALKDALEECEYKLQFIKYYFVFLYNHYNILKNIKRLRTPEEYCREEFPQQTLQREV